MMSNRRTMTDLTRWARTLLGGVLMAAGTTLVAEPAAADFRLCNNTGSRVGIAIGYKENEGWATEGWWNLSPRSCETLMRGPLVARYYYIYAVDYDPAANGRDKRSCALATRSSPSAAPRTASPAASTEPASSKSIPASSRPGRCSSPT